MSMATSWKHHGADIILNTIYIETINLKAKFLEFNECFKERQVCVLYASSYMYVSFKLQFNSNAYNSMFNLISN